MNKLIKILGFSTLCIIPIHLKAEDTPKIIPPSPNAASLGTYGEIPVGIYTGTPNINIPLYDVLSGSINVPISLNYHASGIKVSQEASWVGLGWSLNAGGIITRTIRGWDDLSTETVVGYPFGLDLPPDSLYTIPTYGPAYGQYSRYAMNEADPEPDIFYYNFGNFSGKMMISKDGPLIFNQDPLEIQHLNSGFIIKTPDGNVYYFGTGEETTIYNHLLASNTRILRNIQPNVINSWYLDSIVSPRNDKVIFNYKKNTACIRSQISAMRRTFLDANPDTPCLAWVLENEIYGVERFYGFSYDSDYDLSFSETVVDEILLDEIIFTGGRIEFSTKDRTDLIANNSLTPQCLDKIMIYNNVDSLIALYQFGTSYFQSSNGTSSDQNRLRLDQITDLSGRRYSFTYNDEQLPKKTSGSTDHWGFYNGKNNEISDMYAAIPTIEYSTGSLHTIYVGADREASEQKAKAAILNRIDYPTGGYTKFVYELNEYNNFSSSIETVGFESISESLIGGNSRTIYLPATAGIQFQFTFTKNEIGCLWEGGTCDSLQRNDCNNSYFELQRKQLDDTWATEEIYFYRNLGCFDGETLKIGINRTLSAGEYQIIVNSFETLDLVCNYRYAYRPSNAAHHGGGLRIKEIESSDGENINTKKYEYTMLYNNETQSSGILMSRPLYHFTISPQILDGIIRLTDGTYARIDTKSTFVTWTISTVNGSWTNLDISNGSYTKATSETIKPMGTSAQGNPIGYSQVTEITNSAASNGRTVYYFSNYPEYANHLYTSVSSLWLNFPGIPNLMHHSNGNLLKKEYWNSQGQLLKEEMYEYTRGDSVYNVKGVKLYPIGSIIIPDSQYPSKPIYLFRFYDNISEKWNLTKDSVIIYDYSVSPVGKIRQASCYFYDNYKHRQLTRKKTITSNGKVLISTINYPADINFGIYNEMASKHMHSYPIEQITKVDNNCINSKLTTYKTDEGNIVPDKVYTAKITTPIGSFTNFNGITMDPNYGNTPEVDFLKYDSTGNMVKAVGKNGIYIYYLWAYNSQYPVAKIESSLDTAILVTVNDNNLSKSDQIGDINDDIACLSSLLSAYINNPDYMVTLYTYSPLIGLTSQTDPSGRTTYYEYDDFGRLQYVRDHQGNIMTKHDYHYANQ